MSSRSYPRLGVVEFGTQLLESRDLDPVYVALHELKKRGHDPRSIDKWLVAYWCYYSCGVACHMAEQPDDTYWAEMMRAAVNVLPPPHGGRWERGPERRHFRGAQGVKAVQELTEKYPRPSAMVDHLCEHVDIMDYEEEMLTFAEVSEKVKGHRGFGDWIAFKVGDMLERVVGVQVDFSQAEVFMFQTPREAAIMAYEQLQLDQRRAMPQPSTVTDEGKISRVVSELRKDFADHSAPPGMDRPVDLQEIETILCKWKSHVNGHYPLLHDVHEIRQGLQPWLPHSQLAGEFLQVVPTGVTA